MSAVSPTDAPQELRLLRLARSSIRQQSNPLEPTFLARWFNKFPPSTTPRFLVDLGESHLILRPQDTDWTWKVIHVQSLLFDTDLKAAKTLLDNGWGALSYQWVLPVDLKGWKTRPVYAKRTSEEHNINLPAAYVPPGADEETKKAYDWGIPNLTSTHKTITITLIKSALLTMQKRFVWWDLACLPQRDFSKGFFRHEKYSPQGPPLLPLDLQDIFAEECAKQKFVYQRAAVGVVWLNRVMWGKFPITSQAHQLEKVLQRMLHLMIDVDRLQIMVNRELDGSLTPVGKQPSYILSAMIKEIQADQHDLSTEAGWKTALTNIVKTINAINSEDKWFTSLWSFQEGRLLSNQAFIDRKGAPLDMKQFENIALAEGQPKLLYYDEAYKPIRFPFVRFNFGLPMDSPTVNYPSIRELSSFVTLLASQISVAYTKSRSSNLGFPIDALVGLWTRSYDFMENIMQDLTSTGLLFNSGGAPLELLLAARRRRFPSLYYRDEYFAMEGVLDLIRYSDYEDYSIQGSTKGNGYPEDDGPHGRLKDWLYEDLPKAMFQAMIKRHQWHCLMFAKRTLDHVNHWGAISMGHYETINCYCAQLMVQNEFKVDRQNWNYVLPKLTYLPTSDEIRLEPPTGSLQSTPVDTLSAMNHLHAATDNNYRIGRFQQRGYALLHATLEDDGYRPDTRGLSQEINDRRPKHSKPIYLDNLPLTDLLKDKYRDDPPYTRSLFHRTGETKPSHEQSKPWLLIPLETLNYDLITPEHVKQGITQLTTMNDPRMALAAEQGRHAKEDIEINPWFKLNQRCLRITDIKEQRINIGSGVVSIPYVQGVFEGIVDCSNVVATPLLTSEIRLKWQHNPDSRSTISDANNNANHATTPSGSSASSGQQGSHRTNNNNNNDDDDDANPLASLPLYPPPKSCKRPQ